MAVIKPLLGHTPQIGNECWLAEDAVVIGDVIMGDQCSVWFKAVIRGDVCPIRIGHKTNIQDGAIIHGTYHKSETHIGNNVSIAHGAIIHGCTIHDNVMVGMRAVILDHVIIESNVVIAAGAVVLEKSILKSGFIYGGVPAKQLKALDPEQTQFHITRTADAYVKYASWYRD